MSSNSSDHKPTKPTPDFPLYAHARRKWAKKILGKTYYFGDWDDPQGALASYLAVKDDLEAGRDPETGVPVDQITVRQLIDNFLLAKEKDVATDQLKQVTLDDYIKTIRKVLHVFGEHRPIATLGAKDFKRLYDHFTIDSKIVTLGNHINKTRVLFNHGLKTQLLSAPLVYGDGFKRPTRKSVRIYRASRGKWMFEAHELREIIDAAPQPLRVMIMLGINCGFGNEDCGRVPISAFTLTGPFPVVEYPRPKTGVNRRVPLWPETIAAIDEWLLVRPLPVNAKHEDLLFLTKYGNPWASDNGAAVCHEMRKLLNNLNIDAGLTKDSVKKRRSFYALRHTFETIGASNQDQKAVCAIMGHVEGDMASRYCEMIDDWRLKQVTDHIRQWLATGNTRPIHHHHRKELAI